LLTPPVGGGLVGRQQFFEAVRNLWSLPATAGILGGVGYGAEGAIAGAFTGAIGALSSVLVTQPRFISTMLLKSGMRKSAAHAMKAKGLGKITEMLYNAGKDTGITQKALEAMTWGQLARYLVATVEDEETPTEAFGLQGPTTAQRVMGR